MSEKTMTLAEALALKKSMKSKIDRRLIKIKLAYLTVSEKDLEAHKTEYNRFINEMKSVYQSLITLKNNYNILCCAISTANAKTKTDMVDTNGENYTISQLLNILSNHIDTDIVAAMDLGYHSAECRQLKFKNHAIIDPFGDSLRAKITKDYDEFKEAAELAIQKANAKKKIKVNFTD